MANELVKLGGEGAAVVKLDSPMAIQPQTSGSMVQASGEVAKVMVAMQAAKAFPRNEVKAIDKAKMQCMRPGLAKVAMYAYSRGGASVEGPSSRLLEMIAACWGNIRHGYKIVERGEDYTKVEAFCIDLETNTESVREETIKHYRKAKGKYVLLTDERDIREYVASWAVRAERACMEKIIPRDVVDECCETCNQTMALDDKNTDPEKIKALINAFAEYKVTVPMIEAKIQRHVDAILPAQVIQLRKIFQGLKEGYATVEQFFTVDTAPTGPTGPTGATGAEAKKSESDKIADAFGLKKGSSLVK